MNILAQSLLVAALASWLVFAVTGDAAAQCAVQNADGAMLTLKNCEEQEYPEHTVFHTVVENTSASAIAGVKGWITLYDAAGEPYFKNWFEHSFDSMLQPGEKAPSRIVILTARPDEWSRAVVEVDEAR